MTPVLGLTVKFLLLALFLTLYLSHQYNQMAEEPGVRSEQPPPTKNLPAEIHHIRVTFYDYSPYFYHAEGLSLVFSDEDPA